MLEKFKQKALEKAATKMISDDFSLDDFLKQLNKLGKIGNLSKMMPNIGGVAGRLAMNQINDKFIDKCKSIISAMNEEERKHPNQISNERKMEIADISNTSVSDINKLIKQFEQGKKMMQMLKNKSSKKSE
jgi:signal recognition particle subunit SRP54